MIEAEAVLEIGGARLLVGKLDFDRSGGRGLATSGAASAVQADATWMAVNPSTIAVTATTTVKVRRIGKDGVCISW